MISQEQTDAFRQLCDAAQRIVVIQADNPDADSLGTSLALEEILGERGKDVILYCGVDMPTYLRYLPGWDRVIKDLPHQFDLSIIVDASTVTLLQKLDEAKQLGWLATRPCIVLDHHGSVQNVIDFARLAVNDADYSSTGELIYALAKQLDWQPNLRALEHIAVSILGDTQGLMNDLATAGTYRVMAELVEKGVNRPHLEEKRREYGKMPEMIFKYKADLIQRTELTAEGRVASVTIPQAEINQYSPLYNPAPLIQSDMLQIEGVAVAIVLKHYDDGKITAAIRCNPGYGVASQLAEHFGGGGHAYASGFKITDGRTYDAIKAECITEAARLLDSLEQGQNHEAV